MSKSRFPEHKPLLLLILVTIAILNNVIWRGCSASLSMDKDDIYVQKEVEMRPNTRGEYMNKSATNDFMKLTMRDFHLNCDGQCFYHSGSQEPTERCETKIINGSKNCNLGASIAKHSHLTCGFIGEAVGKSINNSICSAKEIYTITLFRKFEVDTCRTFWNSEAKALCLPKEFVAIAFYTGNGTAGYTASDFWYVCTAGEQTVTYWTLEVNSTGEVTGARQYEETYPRKGSIPGLIMSQIVRDIDRMTLICQFSISADEQVHLPRSSFAPLAPPPVPPVPNPPPQPTTAPTPVFLPKTDEVKTEIKIKMAQGRVYPHAKRVPPNGTTPTVGKDDSIRVPDFQLKSKGKTADAEPDESLFVGEFQGPSKTTILFDRLKVVPVTVRPPIDADKQMRISQEIKIQIRRCDSPDDTKLKCFYPSSQRNCIYSDTCKVMLIVEAPDKAEKLKDRKIKFRLLGYQKKETSMKRVLRPNGWIAVAFSHDHIMGEDLVISCIFAGDFENEVVVSWNVRHANIYHPNANQHIIQNIVPAKIVKTVEADRVMCEWTMSIKVAVDVTPYQDPYNNNQSPAKVDNTTVDSTTVNYNSTVDYITFDLSQDFFLLLASGYRIYKKSKTESSNIYKSNSTNSSSKPEYRMGYHNFRQTIREKFNASDLFSSGSLARSGTMGLICGLVVSLWGLVYFN